MVAAHTGVLPSGLVGGVVQQRAAGTRLHDCLVKLNTHS